MSPLQVAQLCPQEERCPSPEPFLHKLQGPQHRSPPPDSPNRAPIERYSIARALLQRFLKVSGKLAPFQVPQRGPYGKTSVTRAFFYITLSVPNKGAPLLPGSLHIAPIERVAPFPEPSFNSLSEFTVNGPPPIRPIGAPMERDARLQSFLLHIP